MGILSQVAGVGNVTGCGTFCGKRAWVVGGPVTWRVSLRVRMALAISMWIDCPT